MLDIHLAKDKTTKNTVRFGEQPDDADSHPVELYLSKERWETLGRPEDLSLKIDSMIQGSLRGRGCTRH